MPQSAPVSANALEKIIAFLAPLFMIGGQYDLATAAETATQMLPTYGAPTNKEIRIAALIIAFGVGALASRSQSFAAELSVNQILRLRGNANSLHRVVHNSQEALDQLPVSARDPDLIALTRSAPMSRETRRDAERHAEETRHRQREAARQAARAAERSAARQAA